MAEHNVSASNTFNAGSNEQKVFDIDSDTTLDQILDLVRDENNQIDFEQLLHYVQGITSTLNFSSEAQASNQIVSNLLFSIIVHLVEQPQHDLTFSQILDYVFDIDHLFEISNTATMTLSSVQVSQHDITLVQEALMKLIANRSNTHSTTFRSIVSILQETSSIIDLMNQAEANVARLVGASSSFELAMTIQLVHSLNSGLTLDQTVSLVLWHIQSITNTVNFSSTAVMLHNIFANKHTLELTSTIDYFISKLVKSNPTFEQTIDLIKTIQKSASNSFKIGSLRSIWRLQERRDGGANT